MRFVMYASPLRLHRKNSVYDRRTDTCLDSLLVARVTRHIITRFSAFCKITGFSIPKRRTNCDFGGGSKLGGIEREKTW
jgi:hypothetical protein